MTVTDGREALPHAVDEALRTMRESARAEGRHDVPGSPGTVDPAVLRSALATLPHDDQQLLWDVHVHGRGVETIAREKALHARAVRHRLRRAEERLAAGFAAAHARYCAPGCLETRTSLQDYVRHQLGTRRRDALESHLFSCEDCMRAFIEIREAGWALRDAAPALLAGTAGLAAAGPVVIGVGGAASSGLGTVAWVGSAGAAVAGAWERFVRAVRQLGPNGVGAATATGVAVVALLVLTLTAAEREEPSAAVPPLAAGPGAPAPAPVVPSPAAASPADTEPETEEPAPEPTPTPETSPADVPPVGSAVAEPTPDPAPHATDRPTDPEPEPSGEPTPRPTPAPSSSPSPSPTSTQSPSPSPTPTPSPTPSPSPTPPVVVEVTLEVGGTGVYRLVPQGEGAEITGVSTARNTWAEQRPDGDWRVGTTGVHRGAVTVEATGPPGTQPSATLKPAYWHPW